MKNILEYLNNNALAASFITFILSTIIQIIFRINDRKSRLADIRREESYNKPEFMIENNYTDDHEIPRLKLLISDYKIKKTKNGIDYILDKNITNNKKYKHLYFYIRNIGKSNINELGIAVSNSNSLMLCDINDIERLYNDKLVDFYYLYDRKILKNDVLEIDLSFLENAKIINTFSCELYILYRDQYNNFYKQLFFIGNNNIYEPYKITEKEYKKYLKLCE